MDKLEFLKTLKLICDQYDNFYGSWPESKYEGASIFEYASRYTDLYHVCCGKVMSTTSRNDTNGWICPMCNRFEPDTASANHNPEG